MMSKEKNRLSRLSLILFGVCLLDGAVSAQGSRWINDHYVKTELMIPMRDGVELYTQIYEPQESKGEAPIMLFRTPYSVGNYGENITRGMLGPSNLFAERNYIFVYQDVRGKFLSQGDFEVMRPVYSILDDPKLVDESTDTYDTVDWLVENLGEHNSRVGQWGISYPGFQTVMGMINAHPAMVASSPQASPSDMYLGDDFHHNGAFRLMYTFGWLAGSAATRDGEGQQGKTAAVNFHTDDGYKFFMDLGPVANVDKKYFHGLVPTWNEYMKHGNYDSYWSRQEVLQHMHDIKPAVLNVAGWFDAEDFSGPMSIYKTIEKNDAKNRSTLVVGPWQHGGWAGGRGDRLGGVPFDSDTSVFYREEIELPFFSSWLERGLGPELPEAYVFETGVNRWRKHSQWPPKNLTQANLYLTELGGLSFEKPGAKLPLISATWDQFTSDPANPVPFSRTPGLAQGHLWMVEDQRFASVRPDVLVYRTEVLEEPVSIAGSIVASLQVRTTGSDADWVVKLIDVAPAGPLENVPAGVLQRQPNSQQLLAGEVFRSKYRNSFSKPEALVPNAVTEIEFELGDKYHRFEKGHRIMVQIQSSWFPVIDRNPQTFVDIYHAEESDFQVATHRVIRGGPQFSHLKLNLMPIQD